MGRGDSRQQLLNQMPSGGKLEESKGKSGAEIVSEKFMIG